MAVNSGPSGKKSGVWKPNLTFSQIINMNVGFLGIQFSFGLQQTAINPIFSFLGANHHDLPLLNLAGPVTGLLVQPIIGAISDKTWSPRFGRRKPFFLIGAILASLCLFAFPFSPGLWFAVGLLWLLDVGNNTAMEPYRAFVGDKLNDKQLPLGFQVQSLFVGAGITLANFSLFLFQDWFGSSGESAAELCAQTANTIPKWVYYSFFLGAIASIVTILWSVMSTPEIPPSDEELTEIKANKEGKSFLELVFEPIKEIFSAIGDMPGFMWMLSIVYFFQWYALFIYWQFIAPMLREGFFGLTGDDEQRANAIVEACKAGESITPVDTSFALNVQHVSEQALALVSKMNGTYNLVTMIVALALVPLAIKFSSKLVYVMSLLVTGLAMLALPYIHNENMLLLPMFFFGVGWACMMGIPYSMVTKIIPHDRRGVYMGIVNMMIVIPMLIQTTTFGWVMKNLLQDKAVNAILMAGVFFIIASAMALFLKEKKVNDLMEDLPDSH